MTNHRIKFNAPEEAIYYLWGMIYGMNRNATLEDPIRTGIHNLFSSLDEIVSMDPEYNNMVAELDTVLKNQAIKMEATGFYEDIKNKAIPYLGE